MGRCHSGESVFHINGMLTLPRLLACLPAHRHPHVVRMYGYCLEPPHVYILLELLPATLKQRLYPQPSTHSRLTYDEQQAWPRTVREVLQVSGVGGQLI